jgi:hypothetical protein
LTGSGPILAFAAGATTLALLLAWAARTPAPGELGRWAARYELDLRREDRPWVAGELRRGRLLRTLGFTAAFTVGMGANIWWAAVHRPSTAPFPLNLLLHPAAWATGYLSAAALAELTRRGRDRQPVRAAALVPRRLGDYLPGWMLWIERGVALAVLALAPLAHRRTAGAGLAALLFLLGEQVGGLGGGWPLLSSVVGLSCYGLAVGAWKDLTVPLRWRIRRAYGSGASGQVPLSRHDPGRGPA